MSQYRTKESDGNIFTFEPVIHEPESLVIRPRTLIRRVPVIPEPRIDVVGPDDLRRLLEWEQ